jgi:hypothetical protein
MNRCELAMAVVAMKARRLVNLSALFFGFSAVIAVGACAGGGEPEGLPSPSLTGRTPEPVGRIPIPPAPPSDMATECAAEVEKPCMRYLIPLVGNPTMDPALRTAYSIAFGSACYMSDEDPSTFNCFYKTIKKACADAKRIGEVSGNAAYAKTYNCQPVGNGDYWLQIGPDVANKLFIYLQDAPRQSPLIDINGVPTAVNGPYRNLPEPQNLAPGNTFYKDIIDKNGVEIEQRELILQVNRNAHIDAGGIGKIYSDLAGFEYPCDGLDKPLCKEPLVLQEERQYDDDVVQVHHVIRMKDKRCCAWGTNSSANAVVISRKLNMFFLHHYPSVDEVNWVNNIPSYPF